MIQSKEDIIKEIKAYVRKHSLFRIIHYPNWYVGITGHPKDNLTRHKHPPHYRKWQATDAQTARDIERIFLDKKMTGDVGGGTNTVFVYVFKISKNTTPT